MNKRPKPHVRRDLVEPLEKFSEATVKGLEAFDDHMRGMSPIDGISFSPAF